MAKKILFIHYSVYRKSRWGRIYPLAEGAAQCGWDVTLLTSDSQKGVLPSVVYEKSVKVIRYKDIVPLQILKRGFAFFSFFMRLFHVLFNKYDVVYTDCGEAPNCGWIGKVAQWRGATYLSEWGDLLGKGGFYDSKPRLFKLLYGRYYLWAELYFRKSANYTIVLSTMMGKHCIKRGIREEEVKLVPGGAITDIVTYGYYSKEKLGISDNIITLGYIGIDEGEIKDLLPLINVLKDSNYRNKFRLVTFGKKLPENVLNQYGISDIIINWGWLDFYKDYTAAQAVDIYVLLKSNNITRSSMGWPNKLGDYMAIGRPILLNLYGDITDFVQKHPIGFISTDINENSIKKVLDNIWNKNYDLKGMGMVNRKIAEEEISWKARMSCLLNSI